MSFSMLAQKRLMDFKIVSAVVDGDAVGRHAQPDQTVSLSGDILLVSETAHNQ
jgi:hypothetical protein